MTLELPEQLQAFASSVLHFANEELSTYALERARQTTFPRQAARLFATRALTGLVGNSGPSATPTGVLAGVLAIESVARVCPRSADALHQSNFAAALLLARYSANAEHGKHLTAILAGERLLALAVSENNAGAQAAALESRAQIVRDGVILTGSKRFTANSEDADGYIVYARFGDNASDIGALVVERDYPGLVYGEAVTFMSGERWQPMSFNKIRLPHSAIVFASGGFTEKASFFDLEKIGNSARALGLGWCAFDMARKFASERRQFGRHIAEFQGLQWKMADARLGLEAAQLVLYRAAARADRGALRGEDASCAKVLCNRAAMTACDSAVQILGATGYSGDSLAEYCFRKCRGHMINGGVVELMLTRIAEAVFDRKFPQSTG